VSGRGGWIGYWSPGIGDPTVAGWVTVLLYFAAAVVCFRVGRHDDWALPRAERVLYRLLTLALVALGVNKQLDLQTALTELGRMVAAEGDWYDERRAVQKAFIVGVGLTAAMAVAGAMILLRRTPGATHVTFVGALGLVAFVVIRASSFHHVDLLIHSDWYGARVNWLIEMGALLVVISGAWWRGRLLRRRHFFPSARPRPSLAG
jgi:hypothetical protein